MSTEWWQGWGWGCDTLPCLFFRLWRYIRSQEMKTWPVTGKIWIHLKNQWPWLLFLEDLAPLTALFFNPSSGEPSILTWGEVVCHPGFLNVGRVRFRSIPKIPMFREDLNWPLSPKHRSGLQICTWWAEVRSWCLAFFLLEKRQVDVFGLGGWDWPRNWKKQRIGKGSLFSKVSQKLYWCLFGSSLDEAHTYIIYCTYIYIHMCAVYPCSAKRCCMFSSLMLDGRPTNISCFFTSISQQQKLNRTVPNTCGHLNT